MYVLKFDLTYDSTGTSLFGDTFFIFFIFVWQALVKFKYPGKNNTLKPLIVLKEGYCHTDLCNFLLAVHLHKD